MASFLENIKNLIGINESKELINYLNKIKISKKDKQTIRRLLANEYVEQKERDKILFRTVEKQYYPLISFLLKKGARIQTIHYWKQKTLAKEELRSGTIIHYASHKNMFEMIKFLAKKVGLNVRDQYEKTALHYAVENKKEDMIRFLIEHGADVNAKDKDRKTPLHYAVWNTHYYFSNIETIRYLVEKGADVNAKDRWGWTPLFIAIEKGDKETITYLIKKGARTDLKDIFGRGIKELARGEIKQYLVT